MIPKSDQATLDKKTIRQAALDYAATLTAPVEVLSCVVVEDHIIVEKRKHKVLWAESRPAFDVIGCSVIDGEVVYVRSVKTCANADPYYIKTILSHAGAAAAGFLTCKLTNK